MDLLDVELNRNIMHGTGGKTIREEFDATFEALHDLGLRVEVLQRAAREVFVGTEEHLQRARACYLEARKTLREAEDPNPFHTLSGVLLRLRSGATSVYLALNELKDHSKALAQSANAVEMSSRFTYGRDAIAHAIEDHVSNGESVPDTLEVETFGIEWAAVVAELEAKRAAIEPEAKETEG